MTTQIKNTNAKGQFHGYVEFSSNDGKLWHRCNYENGKEIGYEELLPWKETTYYIR